ncbi:hydroxyacid dehydrogenase [Paenibacillus agricola]|uniref:Hydroxyacid dehydrogenase n=1 Tax=Paenibacillus agricola TaxID=2716264 RepID=A0ABX0JCG8_9BACL|nr:hydroxyacid dehydrogenase [Paenibacillus agricola]NHN33471.1 hydroxyacid dehydrogenase [Paenibacillus agricola]
MERFKVLVMQHIHADGLAVLRNGNCDYVIPERLDDRAAIAELAREADAILVRTAVIDRELIESISNLKVIARHGAGVDNIDAKAAAERGIYVCNTPYANSNSVAEHAVGMMIAISHQMFKGDIALRKGDFEARNRYIGTELHGKTLGIIGLGNIGRRVARKCALGMEMNVIAYDPFITGDSGIDDVRMVDSVHKLVSESDFVSLHIPYVPDLHHIIDRATLALMKKSSFLINCARGGLVDEDALYEALKAGQIAGAAMDVFEQEPPPSQHPLWELDNIIVTPHMSAHTDDAMIAMAVGAAEEIVRILHNEPPISCTNKNLMKSLEVQP